MCDTPCLKWNPANVTAKAYLLYLTASLFVGERWAYLLLINGHQISKAETLPLTRSNIPPAETGFPQFSSKIRLNTQEFYQVFFLKFNVTGDARYANFNLSSDPSSFLPPPSAHSLKAKFVLFILFSSPCQLSIHSFPYLIQGAIKACDTIWKWGRNGLVTVLYWINSLQKGNEASAE